jgi:hypothetical protein
MQEKRRLLDSAGAFLPIGVTNGGRQSRIDHAGTPIPLIPVVAGEAVAPVNFKILGALSG